MGYPADPAGVFESDVHRRVLAHLSDEPIELGDLSVRYAADPYRGLDTIEELQAVLKELSDEKLVSGSKDGYKQTKAGAEKLQEDAVIPEGATPGPALIGGLPSGK